ncbi:hypothetical protein DUNSADRAFT_17087 [Dunaliella salina]|uniref:Secreted protein n=1 Tax=Dunaliella salina TaxID=3046 RepID=A0ABQ7G2G2_DUNSA|nr:hypothetical protein DUNSADRAFT_17087 [Dunaliella salina]|eukprot:KAF5828791.1 hypothetical protein DUNSADRAFT_17087 [Dunaliella salina]
MLSTFAADVQCIASGVWCIASGVQGIALGVRSTAAHYLHASCCFFFPSLSHCPSVHLSLLCNAMVSWQKQWSCSLATRWTCEFAMQRLR